MTRKEAVKQRSDYTFKHNRQMGRHGWLRLTPAYSVKVVREILGERERPLRVLEPFSGTGTTPLCASEMGHLSLALDINPFLVWLGNVKLASYSESISEMVRETAKALVSNISENANDSIQPPPIHNIERWWDDEALRFLAGLRHAIEQEFPQSSEPKDLILIAFCRVMIDVSNAAFNHQSMSFKKDGNNRHCQLTCFDEDLAEVFMREVNFILDALAPNPSGSGSVRLVDSRSLEDQQLGGKFDLLVTSPPYPNRMSYIRELRPYMYWLGFLKEAREAGDLDWKAIGGTWGVATSRLMEWERSKDGYYPGYFLKVLEDISGSHEKNGRLLSNYVGKYFEDIWKHLQSVSKVMKAGAEVHYIIGNSTFYGHVVEAERLYAEMLASLGFTKVETRVIRKRNSKVHLYEFDVCAVKPG